MFQFSGFAHLSVYYLFKIVGCPIQVFTDHIVCADPRNFSQLITPFIASESLGIPHTPLFCLLYFAQLTTKAVSLSSVLSTFYYFLISICQWTLMLNLFQHLWRITESNRWPPACKAGALASWANPPIFFNYELWIMNYELHSITSQL